MMVNNVNLVWTELADNVARLEAAREAARRANNFITVSKVEDELVEARTKLEEVGEAFSLNDSASCLIGMRKRSHNTFSFLDVQLFRPKPQISSSFPNRHPDQARRRSLWWVSVMWIGAPTLSKPIQFERAPMVAAWQYRREEFRWRSCELWCSRCSVMLWEKKRGRGSSEKA